MGVVFLKLFLGPDIVFWSGFFWKFQEKTGPGYKKTKISLFRQKNLLTVPDPGRLTQNLK
jgi:hypothetical protein